MRRPAFFLAMLVASAAHAQFPLAGPTYEFSFSNPGARSMGFGGAFVALADDATAAFANPAGLTQLTRPEVSIEGRYWSYTTPFTRGGRLVGAPTGIGLDDTRGLRRGEDETDLTRLSFLALVYPKRRWSLAFYRHRLASFETAAETQGLFGPGSDCCPDRFPDARIATEFAIIGYGLSGAYELTERLSLGGTLIWFDGRWQLTGENFFPDDDLAASQFREGSYLPERLFLRSAVTMDDTDWSGTFGLLWRFADLWRLGLVFRDAPNFRFVGRSWAGPIAQRAGFTPGQLISEQPSFVDFPDVVGLGLSRRSRGERFTIAFEWDRVFYSAAIESTNPELGTAGLVLEDGNELRLGTEYVFLDSSPLVGVRLGVWNDPDHTTRFEGADIYRRSLLPRGESHLHYAAGVGVAFERFQIDLGVDLSEIVQTASISAIYSF
jgi:hypothetical protein